MAKEFINGIHYYIEDTKVVFKEQWHLDRGYCCGNKCRHCPYTPKHKEGTTEVGSKNKKQDIK